jgi:hypothetical protein
MVNIMYGRVLEVYASVCLLEKSVNKAWQGLIYYFYLYFRFIYVVVVD